jgi:hypothetical protein
MWLPYVHTYIRVRKFNKEEGGGDGGGGIERYNNDNDDVSL